MSKKSTLNEWVDRFKLIHEDKYEYINLVYNNITKIKYKCNKCNNYIIQSVYDHFKGHGCKYCNGGYRKSYDDWVRDFNSKYSNKYTYLESFIKDNKTIFKIKCNRCNNIFNMNAATHLHGKECSKCNREISINKRKQKHINKINFFINYNNLPYKLLKYDKGKCNLLCATHNVNFKINWTNFKKSKVVCPVCKDILRKKLAKNKWKLKAEKNGVDTTKYILCSVVSSDTSIRNRGIIQCKEHKLTYTQILDDYAKGHIGCNRCRVKSKQEIEFVEWFDKTFNYYYKHNDRSMLKSKEIDLFLEDFNLGFEYNGLIWHSSLFKDPNNINLKLELSNKLGFKLRHIYDDDWRYKRHIVEAYIKKEMKVLYILIDSSLLIFKKVNESYFTTFLNENTLYVYDEFDNTYDLYIFSDDYYGEVCGVVVNPETAEIEIIENTKFIITNYKFLLSNIMKNYNFNICFLLQDINYTYFGYDLPFKQNTIKKGNVWYIINNGKNRSYRILSNTFMYGHNKNIIKIDTNYIER